MKTGLDSALVDALLNETARVAIFVDCQFTTPIRRSNLDVDYYLGGVTVATESGGQFVWDGSGGIVATDEGGVMPDSAGTRIDISGDQEKYEAGGVEIGSIIDSAGLLVSRTKIKLANADRSLSAVLLANNENGKTIIVHIAAIDDGGALIGSGTLFRGMLSGYEIGDDAVTLDVVNELILWKKRAARRGQSSCPWPFGGTECGYSGGESWCDQTYDRCTVLGNTDNFGGNRFLPDLMQKRIWWGRVQA